MPEDLTSELIFLRGFQVLRLLIKLYESSESPDWVSICQCLMFLDDAPEVAKILDQLLKGDEVSPKPFWQSCILSCMEFGFA